MRIRILTLIAILAFSITSSAQDVVKVEGHGKLKGRILDFHPDSLLTMKMKDSVIQNIYLNRSMKVNFIFGSRAKERPIDEKKIKTLIQLGPAFYSIYQQVGIGEVRVNPSYMINPKAQVGLGLGVDLFSEFKIFQYYGSILGFLPSKETSWFYNLRIGVGDVTASDENTEINKNYISPFYELDLGLNSKKFDKIVFLYSLGIKRENYVSTRANWWSSGETRSLRKMQFLTFRVGLIF